MAFVGFAGLHLNRQHVIVAVLDEEIELVGFTHAGGDLDKKIASLEKNGVTTVHLSTCMRGKNDQYEDIAARCAEKFDVVGYTHGGPVSKDGKEAIILDKQV